MSKLLSNRAMAFSKGGRHADALADALEATKLAPAWDKPYWRQGTALLGLQRLPEAVAAFVQAWKVSNGELFFIILDLGCLPSLDWESPCEFSQGHEATTCWSRHMSE